MLAQNFKSAAELEITEAQKEALMKTLVLLETGKLVHVPNTDDLDMDFAATDTFSGHFNMNDWAFTYKDCGTVCCIGGTAELISNVKFNATPGSRLRELFFPESDENEWHDITPSQAATALRSYLTTGDAKWHEAVA